VKRAFTYATRRSKLALTQARAIVAEIGLGLDHDQIRELQVVTSGDLIQDRPLSEVGGKGLFVKEIEEALLDKRADFAVHSLKDMPSDLPPGLVFGAITRREDPRDAFCARRYKTLDELPAGATVGTSSLRRALSIKRFRADLVILPLRGNVDTRLRKLEEGEFDAIILAAAGLRRLSLEAKISSLVPADIMVPSVGQGALAIECRTDDVESLELLRKVHNTEVATCVEVERAVMRALGGDCKTPMGAHAICAGRLLTLRAWTSKTDGTGFRMRETEHLWPKTLEEANAIGDEEGRKLMLPSARPGSN
jgi:hydroxymethylbilane synthase